MVQYYRDLWARWSKMLTPLTSLVAECGKTKVTKEKGTKKITLALGQSPSKSFQSRKGYYHKRSGLDLSRLIKSL
jgi:hypothetical protein